MIGWQLMVWEFNLSIGSRLRVDPGWCDFKDLKLSQKLIHEEKRETDHAIESKDLPAVADGLADLIYVCLGLACRLGIDLGPVFDRVHAANMAKLKGPKREDGKQLKPPGWQPPDIAGELKRQGWEG